MTDQRDALEELIRTAAEVHRISDRAHDAWIALSHALKTARNVLAEPAEQKTRSAVAALPEGFTEYVELAGSADAANYRPARSIADGDDHPVVVSLARWLMHEDGCEAIEGPAFKYPCTCGLDAAIAAVRG